MVAIILLVSFLLIHAALRKSTTAYNSERAILLSSLILFATFIVGTTELLSFFYSLNYGSLLLSWGLFIVVLCIYLKLEGIREYQQYFVKQSQEILAKIRGASTFEQLMLATIGFVCLITFFQGVMYPPNNWDSMTYHMTRIVHWIGNESVAHYPTSDYRQLYQPPLSEFFILQINLLAGNDIWSFIVQWGFLVAAGLSVSLLAKMIGLSAKYQLFAAFFIFTIPIVYIQASSTKNYIVQGFFLLESIRYLLLFWKDKTVKNSCLLGLAVGLSLMAKATSYIFLFPFLIMFGLLWLRQIFQNKVLVGRFIKLACVMVFFGLMMNGGHYARGIDLTGHPLGLPEDTGPKVTVEDISLSVTMSNVLRNLALHGGPFPISLGTEIVVKKIHELIGWDVNKETSYNQPFDITNYPNGVGDAPNPIHLLLVLMAFGFILIKAEKQLLKVGIGAWIIAFLFFCGYLKWEPWHARLHSPLFMLAGPLAAYFFQRYASNGILEKSVIGILMLYTLVILPLCASRPLVSINGVTTDINPFEERFRKFFSGRPDIYRDYQIVKMELATHHYKNIGSKIKGAANWSYPLFDDIYSKPFNVYNLDVSGISRRAAKPIPSLDIIIGQAPKTDSLLFQNRVYKLKELNTDNLFLYLPTIQK